MSRAKHEVVSMGAFDKYAHIFDDVSKEANREMQMESEDDLYYRNLRNVEVSLCDFLGLDQQDRLEDVFVDMSEYLDEKREVASEILEESNAKKAEKTSEEWINDHYAEMEYLSSPTAGRYAATEEEKAAERNARPEGSRTTDRVVTGKSRTPYSDSSTVKNSFGSTSGRTGFTSPGTSAKSDGERKTKRGIDSFYDMNRNVQAAASKRNDAWNEPSPEEVSGYFAEHAHEKKWWQKAAHKTKSFFKSGKGRITLKVAMVIGLQLTMAVYGKKYEFDNVGQMMAMLGFMVGSFFLTRELAEDGIDVSGMII